MFLHFAPGLDEKKIANVIVREYSLLIDDFSMIYCSHYLWPPPEKKCSNVNRVKSIAFPPDFSLIPSLNPIKAKLLNCSSEIIEKSSLVFSIQLHERPGFGVLEQRIVRFQQSHSLLQVLVIKIVKLGWSHYIIES